MVFSRQHFTRLLRFGVTGIGATIIHVFVATACIECWSTGVVVANGMAFLLATCFSYTVNTLWSFGAKVTLQNAAKFWTVACACLVLAMLLAQAAEQAGWSYLGGIGLVVVVVPITSYLLHSWWSYR